MTGNTLGSISRNCIYGDYGFIAITGGKAKPKTDTDGSKYLQLGPKKIFYCGADNDSSFKKIRGLTIGGWYADEIQLHAKTFIETALARSFAAIGASTQTSRMSETVKTAPVSATDSPTLSRLSVTTPSIGARSS